MKRADLLRVLSSLNIKVVSENKHWLNAHCPLAPFTHRNGRDSSPSFGALWSDEGRSSFACKACKAKGSIANLVSRLGQARQHDVTNLMDEVRAIEQGAVATISYPPFDRPLGQEHVNPLLKPLNPDIYDGLYPRAWDVAVARDYLIKRGISGETSEKLGLLFRDKYLIARPDGTKRDWYRDDIVFPVMDRARNLYGFTGRTTRSDIKPKVFDKDLPKRHLILGEERWIEGRPTIIEEGLFGYAHLIEIGCEDFANVGCLMGSVMTPEKAAILKAWGNAVCLMFDNDTAGEMGLYGAIDAAGNRDPEAGAVAMLINALLVKVPVWPVWPRDCIHLGVEKFQGNQKEDPDELSREEVAAMVFETPLAMPISKNRVKYNFDKYFIKK